MTRQDDQKQPAEPPPGATPPARTFGGRRGRRLAERLAERARQGGRLARRTVAQAWSDRVLGLSAEAGFWALLSLTPLLVVLVACIGYLTPLFGTDVVADVESRILAAAEQVLAPSAVREVVKPVLADVLRHGSGGIVSAGFILALWTGSAAMSTYVNAITIAYGMRDVRSAVRARALAFALYLGALATGVITLPVLVAAPGWIIAATPAGARPALTPLVRYGYWPFLIVVCTGLLVTLYHLATPVRRRWHRDLPGAIVAMLLWLGGSLALRWFLSAAITHNPAYGVLAAPAAALLFLYVTALAVLLGAELNAQLDRPAR
ncbi:YihY/virulence factor BrkB family protein [Spirillospora sp. NPDC048911]|uniref:YihY/virulence factor BrkB family protein n=1 Tax=Spirillospora sp. NPDC048911 TaxID=3364527 RepID=UPI00371C2495